MESYTKRLANIVGEYVKEDLERMIKPEGPLMRVRVLINIEQPLMAKIRLEQEDRPEETVTVQYESLSLFCFH